MSIPWTTWDIAVFVALLFACVTATGLPVDFLFRGRWRTDRGALSILVTTAVMAFALDLTAVFVVLFHVGITVDETFANIVNLLVFLAVGAAKGDLWRIMRRDTRDNLRRRRR